MVLKGKTAAPGIAAGSIYIYNDETITPLESFVLSGEEHIHLDRYLSVKNHVIEELEVIRLSMKKVDADKALIFEAQKEIADDIIINEEIPAKIINEKWSGDWAIYQVYENVLSLLRKTDDPLIAERAADFDDVRSHLLKSWYTGKINPKNKGLSCLTEPVIIAAHDLKPSDTVCLDKNKVLAILTETGGETCHTAIIARSFGIPSVFGIEGLLGFVKQGQQAVVDAVEGKVLIDPSCDIISAYLKKSETFRRDREGLAVYQNRESRTLCGTKIDIGLNISAVFENVVELEAEKFTDYAGLLRTEFLFLGKNAAPAEEEQFAYYRKVLECFGKKPVIMRTLDIGADKQVSYLNLKREENPFLGIRGVRYCFENTEIFTTQIKAALRASVYGNLWLMLPMIGSIDEIKKAKDIIAQAKKELKKEKKKTGDYKLGIMIEIPSIALIADIAAREADFASIGTNDLCQYVCAADRTNSSAAPYYNQFHPAMFRLLKQINAAFTAAGKPISICGELGSDPLAAPALIGLGFRRLSMSASSVADVKRKIASLSLEQAKKAAESVVNMTTAEEVKKYLDAISK